jgi:hypothetical protein
MPDTQTLITIDAMQQMFKESEERLEKKLVEKFESDFLNIYRKISSLEGLFRFINQSMLGIRNDVDILKREVIQVNKRFDNLEVRFDTLETRFDTLEVIIDKRFDTLTNEMMLYASAGLDNHELRITALEKNKPMIS